jgi:hypothetical protein
MVEEQVSGKVRYSMSPDLKDPVSSDNKSDQYVTMYKSNIVRSGVKHQIYINC